MVVSCNLLLDIECWATLLFMLRHITLMSQSNNQIFLFFVQLFVDDADDSSKWRGINKVKSQVYQLEYICHRSLVPSFL